MTTEGDPFWVEVGSVAGGLDVAAADFGFELEFEFEFVSEFVFESELELEVDVESEVVLCSLPTLLLSPVS